MSDKKLYQLCRQYGRQALEARNKFKGLLPEVFNRELYKKKGFESIYHFAAVLAGLSREHVDQVLRLERKFVDKPVLRKALIEGEISSHKLHKVASIATQENQQQLLTKVRNLSCRALEQAVRDHKSVHVNTKSQQSLPQVNLLEHLSPELQQNLISRMQKGVDINHLLIELLKKHDREKEKLSNQPAKSRHIPAKIKKILTREHGSTCSEPNCSNKATAIHHKKLFRIFHTHDPRFLAPLCKQHHEIAHVSDPKYQLAKAACIP